MDKHDILIVSKSDDNSIYITTKGDIFEIAAAIKAITGGIVHHTMENRGKSDAIATASLFAEAAMVYLTEMFQLKSLISSFLHIVMTIRRL